MTREKEREKEKGRFASCYVISARAYTTSSCAQGCK